MRSCTLRLGSSTCSSNWRLKGRRGGLVAELFWRLMVHGVKYVEQGLKQYEEKVARTEQRLLEKLAKKYNLVLQPKVA